MTLCTLLYFIINQYYFITVISRSNVLSNYQNPLRFIFSLGRPGRSCNARCGRSSSAFASSWKIPKGSINAIGAWPGCLVLAGLFFHVLEATISPHGKSCMVSGRFLLSQWMYHQFLRFLLMCYWLALTLLVKQCCDVGLWPSMMTAALFVWKTLKNNIKNNNKYYISWCMQRRKNNWRWRWWLTAPLRTRCSSVLRHLQLRRCAP